MATDTAIEKQDQGEVTRSEFTRSGRHFRPNVDILEGTDELQVLVDMPGVQARNVDINFENGTLSIDGKVQQRQAEDTRFLLQEYGIGDFHRTFQVSEAIDANKISAEHADGVLTVHLPKADSARPRKITVQAK